MKSVVQENQFLVMVSGQKIDPGNWISKTIICPTCFIYVAMYLELLTS